MASAATQRLAANASRAISGAIGQGQGLQTRRKPLLALAAPWGSFGVRCSALQSRKSGMKVEIMADALPPDKNKELEAKQAARPAK
jgi:hypothetical protein